MPVYEFSCDTCGGFDQRRSWEQAGDPLACPSCARTAKRVYTAPGTRSTSGVLAAASAADRSRVDRARTGEPRRSGSPAGGRVPPRAPHVH